MIRYQILLEYEGTQFNGWQIQKSGNSVQKTVQLVLSKLLRKRIKIHGAGRTDKGVHSLEQSAHFDTQEKIINIPNLIISLNFFLNKKQISILKIKKKNLNFHARYSAKKRTYKYLIRNNLSPSVINKNREWHIINILDIEILRKGAKKFVGTHDFSTFRASNCNAKSPIRTIYKVKVTKNKSSIEIKFVSKSFLKSQIRSMVGCLKYLAERKWTLKKFDRVFKSKNRNNCAPLAPPCGLYLEKISY